MKKLSTKLKNAVSRPVGAILIGPPLAFLSIAVTVPLFDLIGPSSIIIMLCGSVIGLSLFFGCVYPGTKEYAVSKFHCSLPNGISGDCIVVKVNYHFLSSIIPFICLFRFVPLYSEYYLIKDVVGFPNINERLRLPEEFVNANIGRAVRITSKEAKVLPNNPMLQQQILMKDPQPFNP